MKIIDTTRFGQLEYSEKEVIVFEKGIPGFEQEKEFILVKMDSEDQLNPLAFLQSINSGELSFIIASPFSFYADYEFDLDDATKEDLKIKEPEDVAVWGILSVPEEFEKTTINLQAPVIINLKKKVGKQIILHDSKYATKTPLFPQKVTQGGK